MKRIICTVLLLVLTLFMVGCNDDNDKNTYTLNDILGYDKSEVTKIEYSITSGPTTGVSYEVDVKETINLLDIEYNKLSELFDVTWPSQIALFGIYNNEKCTKMSWDKAKGLLIIKNDEIYYSKDPVELLTINEYNKNVKYANSLFDLGEEKVIWNGSIDDEFTDDLVLLVLKHSDLFPELELKHFGLKKGRVEYVGGPMPPDYFFEPEYEDKLNNYKQIVFIHVEPEGKEKIIELIRYLEQINFIYAVTPNHIQHGGV